MRYRVFFTFQDDEWYEDFPTRDQAEDRFEFTNEIHEDIRAVRIEEHEE